MIAAVVLAGPGAMVTGGATNVLVAVLVEVPVAVGVAGELAGTIGEIPPVVAGGVARAVARGGNQIRLVAMVAAASETQHHGEPAGTRPPAGRLIPNWTLRLLGTSLART